MAKNLVIVESPAKAKTISKFLGSDFHVMASMGHVRDLPKSKMGIDIEDDFKPSYSIPQDKKEVISRLRKLLSDRTVIWLATDEDREGEAISWHILEALEREEDERVKRIVFHEITKSAIMHAVENPRTIDHHLVDAQQARRVLDRLVGYELSPLLWKKVRFGLSAGRVQSVAVRLVVEREREIEAFKEEEYWTISGQFEKIVKEISKVQDRRFSALLIKNGDEKVVIHTKDEANKILKELQSADYKVVDVQEKTVKRVPAPPFITSTLQQEASRKLGFSVKKTMMIAQQLYEGVDLGDQRMGLITYMRTDSVNMAQSAMIQARKVIEQEFGKEYTLEYFRRYKGKKGAQEAHEAIRPVDFTILPLDISKSLSKDQFHLYELIWKRALSSQMAEAIVNQTIVDIQPESTDYIFRAQGLVVKFPGFMRLYKEDRDNGDAQRKEDEPNAEQENVLPKLSVNEEVNSLGLSSKQHFTKPPPRYTEASLVKKLESEGIGRPSTYAPTISTIVSRGYVVKEGRTLKPTDTAKVVNDILVAHFPSIVDLKFTARMETDLDEIAESGKPWVPIIRDFYTPFHKDIELKDKTLKREDIVNEESSEVCEKCGSSMVIKLGRFGKFLSCSNYPKCKNARPLNGNNQEKTQERKELEKKLGSKKCDKCGKPMEIKDGKYGEFLSCTGYPDCKNIQPIIKFTGVKCAQCQNGQLVERRTRKGGKVFYGCNKYPKCTFATWNKPLKTPCKKCGGILVEKLFKKGGKEGKKVECLKCAK